MRKVAVFLALAGLLFVAVVGIRYRLAVAQTGGPYDLSWSTIDGGGHTFGSPCGTAWRFGCAKSHAC
jgi:hypothetical protein